MALFHHVSKFILKLVTLVGFVTELFDAKSASDHSVLPATHTCKRCDLYKTNNITLPTS
jgi:hypothetical protein